MAIFIYEAINKNKSITKGKLEARDKAEALSFLSVQGMSAVSLEKEGDVAGGRKLSLNLFDTIRQSDLIFLARNMSAMLRAGLNIIEALDILISDTEKKIMKKILSDAKFNIQKGQPLSATFVHYKKYFPPVFAGLIKAGEVSGRLSDSFAELAQYMTREFGLRRKIKSALAYPTILVIGSAGIISLLLFFVLPKLAKSFAASKVELPLITKIFMSLSSALHYSVVLDLSALVFIIWLFFHARKTEIGRTIIFNILLKIPIAKDLVKKTALVRFSRTLGGLISSGLTITESLQLAAESVSNDLYKRVILNSMEKVKKGIPLSRALMDYPQLSPHLFVNMLAVGEKTGSMGSVLRTFSDFYDEEVDGALKDLTVMLEPILLLIMGLIIGAIALSVLLPIYQMVGKFV